MAEWLRRRTDNPLGSASVGSNPIFVVFLFGSLVNWIAICSLNSAIKVQISENKLLSLKPHPPPSLKFRKKQKKKKKKTTNITFEPTLADPYGLTVHRPNHSEILSIKAIK